MRGLMRGDVVMVDFGKPRGHELAYRHPGIVVTSNLAPASWSTVTVVPTSTHAGHARFRPLVEIAGRQTRALADQVRSVDVSYIGEQIDYLTRDQLAEVEDALMHYLGLDPV